MNYAKEISKKECKERYLKAYEKRYVKNHEEKRVLRNVLGSAIQNSATFSLIKKYLAMENETVLEEANRIVNTDRRADYGDAFACQEKVAKLWSTYLYDKLSQPLDAEDTCMMMTLMKIARQTMKRKRDNLVDAAGYLAVYERCEKTRSELFNV